LLTSVAIIGLAAGLSAHFEASFGTTEWTAFLSLADDIHAFVSYTFMPAPTCAAIAATPVVATLDTVARFKDALPELAGLPATTKTAYPTAAVITTLTVLAIWRTTACVSALNALFTVRL